MAPLAHIIKGFDVNSYIDFGSVKGDTTDLEDRRSVPVTTTVLGITFPLGSAQKFFGSLHVQVQTIILYFLFWLSLKNLN